MSERFDLDIAFLHLVAGRPVPDPPPGLAAFGAPRRAARGRERDTLLLCLQLRARGAAVGEDRYAPLLTLAAATFFGTPGSVTAAARQAILAVNKQVLEGNLRAGAPVQGSLICAVLRGTDLYAVQAGPGVLLAARPDAVERGLAGGRPLGLSDVVEAQYFHTTIGLGDYIALSANAAWREADLAGLGGLATLSLAAERLKLTAGGAFTGLLARVEAEGAVGALAAPVEPTEASAEPAPTSSPTGRGWTDRLRAAVGGRGQHPVDEAAEAEAPAEASAPPPPSHPEPLGPEPVGMRPDLAEPPPSEPLMAEAPPPPPENWPVSAPPPEPRPSRRPAPPPEDAEADDEPPPPIARAAEAPAVRLDLSEARERAQHGARSFGRAIGVTLTEGVRAFRKLLARVLPEGMLQQDGLFVVPAWLQIGVAIGLPLLIVAGALLVYTQIGQTQEYEEAVRQAQIEISNGRTLADPLVARPNWENALAWIERAEQLRPSQPELAALRLEAQQALDQLDFAARVGYLPLLPNGVSETSVLTRLLPVGRDVYALDVQQNRVWRLAPNASDAYAVDEGFLCGGGSLGPLTIGPLVDIGLVPGPNVRDGDSVLALDNAGALIYCAPNEAPLGNYLPPPDVGWVQPIALELYADSLYVLDIGQNQLWQYQAAGGVFTQAPRGYFSEVIYDLKDVQDFVIANGEVFLLRRDGRLSSCLRPITGAAATCVETMPYTDARPGRTGGDRLADLPRPAGFVYDQPPEPSLFVINPDNNGLYQLSLKLTYTRQYRPTRDLPQPITALAIDPSKRFYVATGNNIYRGDRP